MSPPRHLHVPLFPSSPSSATPYDLQLPHPAAPRMTPPWVRRSTHTPHRHRLRNKVSTLGLVQERHQRATSMLDRLLPPIRAPALSSQRGWLPRNNSPPSTNANTVERDSHALAASRCVPYICSCIRKKRIEPHRPFQIHVHSHTGERRKCQFILYGICHHHHPGG
jgi:hypothetical protein